MAHSISNDPHREKDWALMGDGLPFLSNTRVVAQIFQEIRRETLDHFLNNEYLLIIGPGEKCRIELNNLLRAAPSVRGVVIVDIDRRNYNKNAQELGASIEPVSLQKVLYIRANVSQLPEFFKADQRRPLFKMIYANDVLDHGVLQDSAPQVFAALKRLLHPDGVVMGDVGIGPEPYGFKIDKRDFQFYMFSHDAAMTTLRRAFLAAAIGAVTAGHGKVFAQIGTEDEREALAIRRAVTSLRKNPDPYISSAVAGNIERLARTMVRGRNVYVMGPDEGGWGQAFSFRDHQFLEHIRAYPASAKIPARTVRFKVLFDEKDMTYAASMADFVQWFAQAAQRSPVVAGNAFEELALQAGIVKALRDQEQDTDAIKPDRAMQTPGGIDLDTEDMVWRVRKDGQGVERTVDPAMVERIRREGIETLTPVIFRVTPMTAADVWPMLGLEYLKDAGWV